MKHIFYATLLICLTQSKYTQSSSNQDLTFYEYELPQEVVGTIKKHREKFTAIEVKNQKKSSIIEAAKEAIEEHRKNEESRTLAAQNTRQPISFSSKNPKIQAILSDSSKTQTDKDTAIKEFLKKEVAGLKKVISQN